MYKIEREELQRISGDEKELEKKLTEWRRYLHMHPETAFEEKNTADFVADILETAGLEVHRNIGGTGVVASLKAGTGSRVIGLRADMDALNMTEAGQSDHCSRNAGKMHGCGHDGHVTMLLGAALSLAHSRDFNGTVRFVFQPAEEPGKGAAAMIRDGLLEKYPMDEIYGLHNRPVEPFGQIITKAGPSNASEDNFTIRILGKGGHASAPQNTVDPLVIAAQVILGLQTVVARNVNPQECAVVSCTELYMDGSHNAIPSNVTIKGDTRSYSPKVQELMEKRMREICENICRANGAECEFTYTHEFAPTINWEECMKKCILAAEKVVGKENVFDNGQASMGSEDFGLFLQHIPGCFVRLGTAEDLTNMTPLHNTKFDFNDKILMTGVGYWHELVRVCLPI